MGDWVLKGIKQIHKSYEMSSCDNKKNTLVAVLSELGGHEGETPWVTIKDSDGKFSFPAQQEDEPTYVADACTATPT